MESLSLRLKHMQEEIHNIESSIQGGSIGGGVSGGPPGSSTFDLGKVSVRPVEYIDGTESRVNVEQEDDMLYFKFSLPRPIDDPQEWGVLGADSVCDHGVMTVVLDSSSQDRFAIPEPINSEPVILFLNNGKAFVEDQNNTTKTNAPFVVDRQSSNAIVRWRPASAPFYLSAGYSGANYLYIYYGRSSNAFLQVREKINVTSISDNSFYLSREPNDYEVQVIINGISYYEYSQTRTIIDGVESPTLGTPEFTVNRTARKVIWNKNGAGFDIDNNLSGYITVLYRTKIVRSS